MATTLNLDTPSKLPGIRPLVATPPAAMTIPEQGGALPSLAPTLRPIVTSPREQRIQFLQQQIQKEQQPGPAKPGFWHRLGRIASGIGNVAGDVLDPAAMEMIPGTQLHNRLELNHNTRELAGLQAMDDTEQNDAAKRNLENFQATPKNAIIPTEQGFFGYNPQTAQTTPLMGNGAPLMPVPKVAPHSRAVNVTEPGGKTALATEDESTGQLYIGGQPAPEGTVLQTRPPALPHPTSGTLDGQPAFALYTPHGWVSTDGKNTPMPGFSPPPSYASVMPGLARNLVAIPNASGGFTLQVPHAGENVPSGVLDISGVNSLNEPTGQEKTAAGRARIVLSQLPQVEAQITNDAGSLGPMMGRWSDFMTGKIGANNPQFASLRQNLMMLSSAVALAHAVGRLPENLREEFDRNLNSPHQTPQNLLATIQMVQPWMQDMASMSTAGFNQNGPTRNTAEHYAMTASGPNGVQIGSNDGGKTWYNLSTGKEYK